MQYVLERIIIRTKSSRSNYFEKDEKVNQQMNMADQTNALLSSFRYNSDSSSRPVNFVCAHFKTNGNIGSKVLLSLDIVITKNRFKSFDEYLDLDQRSNTRHNKRYFQ